MSADETQELPSSPVTAKGLIDLLESYDPEFRSAMRHYYGATEGDDEEIETAECAFVVACVRYAHSRSSRQTKPPCSDGLNSITYETP
jgi:hypothetical protein